MAVSDLTLTVERGEVFGFLGPNGAGKTTAVKMLLGLISPTAGEGAVLGAPLSDHRVRAQIGFLPEHFRFHEWLTANEFLTLHANLNRIPRRVTAIRIVHLLDIVGLRAHADKQLREYSKGMLQRVGLAQALIHKPELVFLDEPTSGLDPVGRRLVRDIIHDLREKGTTVFLNSHLLSEVEITCDRVAFIKQGEVVQISPLGNLMDGEITVEIRAYPLTEGHLNGLTRWSTNIRTHGDRLEITLPSQDDIPAINRFLIEQNVDVYSIMPKNSSLEDLFLQIVGSDGGL